MLAKYLQAPALPYADDGYIKAKTSVALQVLAEHVLKEDAGLNFNVSKTTILPEECITSSFTSVRLLTSST